MYTCKFCGKECKNLNSLAQHEIRCPKNPNRKDYNKLSDFSVQHLKGQTKETSDVVAKYAESLHKAYTDGKIEKHSFSFVSDELDYIHLKHNQKEIEKWYCFLDSNTFDIPKYTTISHNQGYVIISGVYERIENTIKYNLEHNFLMNIILGNKLSYENTVHHINRVRDDNSLHNLLVFDTSTSHKRYHASKRAYLTYDENTHLFHCDLKDIC